MANRARFAMGRHSPKLDQRESLTRRERRVIDRTLGMDEQLLLVTRPDPAILKAERLIHFGIAAFILIATEGTLFALRLLSFSASFRGSGNAISGAPSIWLQTAAALS